MIRIITLTIVSLFYQALQAQVLNNGFENLNSGTGEAKFWAGKTYTISVVIDSNGVKKDSILTDSKNYAVTSALAFLGNYSLVLRNSFNVTQNKSMPGVVFTASDTNGYAGFGNTLIATNERPIGMNFYAMYLPLDADTATATIKVFNASGDEIGVGTLELGKKYSSYTKFNVMLTYSSSDDAAFYSISFASAKDGNRNSVGTALYLDEIELLNATTLDAPQESSFKVFPNPSAGSFKLVTKNNTKVSQVLLVDLNGKQMEVKPTSDGVYWTDNIDDGIYIVMVRSNSFVGKYKLVVRR